MKKQWAYLGVTFSGEKKRRSQKMKSCPRCSLPKAMSVSRSDIFRKQEHKVSYRCLLPSPLQKKYNMCKSGVIKNNSCFKNFQWPRIQNRPLHEFLHGDSFPVIEIFPKPMYSENHDAKPKGGNKVLYFWSQDCAQILLESELWLKLRSIRFSQALIKSWLCHGSWTKINQSK